MPVLNSPLQKNWFDSDDQFNDLYPASIQILSKQHWTPLETARKVAGFLARGERRNHIGYRKRCGKVLSGRCISESR